MGFGHVFTYTKLSFSHRWESSLNVIIFTYMCYCYYSEFFVDYLASQNNNVLQSTVRGERMIIHLFIYLLEADSPVNRIQSPQGFS